MKVSELIEKLQAIDPDTRVVVRGYEDGVDDIETVEGVMLKLNVNSQWYYGRHQVRKDGDCPAVYLS